MGKKHIKYLKYVLRHKWFVFIECCKLGIPLRGVIHDLSKFMPSEWFPYVSYFHGDFGIKNQCPNKWSELKCVKAKFDFDLAWLKHQRRNKHHWQYWILQKDDGPIVIFEMSLKYAKEMLADWIGAGLAISGKRDINEWYEKNKEKIQLHGETRKWVESVINESKVSS